MDFVRSFSKIEDDRVKAILVSLVRAMADSDELDIADTLTDEIRPNA